MGCVRSKQSCICISNVKKAKIETREEEKQEKSFINAINQSSVNVSDINIVQNTSNNLSQSQDNLARRRKSGANIKISTRKLIRQFQPKLIEENYQILNKLGKGSFGTVYKVMEKNTGLTRAMKVIKKESVIYQDDEKVFLKEIEILVKLDHPNIIKIFEYYEDDVNYFLITEYVSGGDLYETISKFKYFDEDQVAYIMYQILTAVHYLHCNNIVHRDIKPENILVEKLENFYESDGRINIKLIDFGTCNYFTKDKNLTLKVGTPYYIAPEVLQRNYNYKIDIWSCGVMLYILLSGKPPFNGNSTKEILEAVKKGKYYLKGEDWKNVSSDAKSLIRTMLEFNSEKRITAENALASHFIQKGKVFKKKVKESQLNKVISNIKNFSAKEKFQQAALAYIVHFFSTSSEIEDLKAIFISLDQNGDGRLSKEELRKGFEKLFGKQMTDIEFSELFDHIDHDQSEFIEYQEFLRVGMCQKFLLSDVNLKRAFDRMDENGDGKLSVQEITNVLATGDEEYINELLQSFDTNKDRELSYEEFVSMMRNMIEKKSPLTSPKKFVMHMSSKLEI